MQQIRFLQQLVPFRGVEWDQHGVMRCDGCCYSLTGIRRGSSLLLMKYLSARRKEGLGHTHTHTYSFVDADINFDILSSASLHDIINNSNLMARHYGYSTVSFGVRGILGGPIRSDPFLPYDSTDLIVWLSGLYIPVLPTCHCR